MFFQQSEALQDLGTARHQYGISALVTQTSFCEGSSGDLAKRRLFSQATKNVALSNSCCGIVGAQPTCSTQAFSSRSLDLA